jgi:2-keto-4-pentenoate hydratase
MILVDVAHAAKLLLELRQTGRTIPELPDGLRPAETAEAYAIQDELHRIGGWEIGALKVGCTSEFAQQALGIAEPIAGRVPAAKVGSSGRTFARSEFHHVPFLECEFALRIGSTVSRPESLHEVSVRSLVDAAAPAIELVNTRYDNALGASGFSTVADNSAATAIVLGAPVDPPGDLASLAVTLRSASGELASGMGAAVLGDPYRSLAWVLRHELGRGRVVEPGTWVITGTCTGLVPCPLDEPVTAVFDLLGDVEVTVAT